MHKIQEMCIGYTIVHNVILPFNSLMETDRNALWLHNVKEPFRVEFHQSILSGISYPSEVRT